jgi:hypothetical protein
MNNEGSRVLPGEWLCRTCGFKLSKRTIGLLKDDLITGVDATLTRETCPNDGTLMDQATEADVIEALNECVESWIRAFEGAGGGWRPLEDLPAYGERVLVLFQCGNQWYLPGDRLEVGIAQRDTETTIEIGPKKRPKRDVWYLDQDDQGRGITPVAWKPLPKPFPRP